MKKRAEFSFTVVGKDLAALEEAAAQESMAFIRTSDAMKVEWSLDASALAGTNGPYPNIGLWEARVHAIAYDRSDGAPDPGRVLC